MIVRRSVRTCRRSAVVATVLLLIAAGCGSTEQIVGAPTETGDATPTSEMRPTGPIVTPVVLEVPVRVETQADPGLAGAAISQFGFDLFTAARENATASNLTVSPTSVAIALGMLEPGTVGDAKVQIRSLLRIDDPVAFHTSMNALEADLEARAPAQVEDDEGGEPGEVTIRIANAAYLQEGYPFNAEYLNAIGADYGPVLYEVDFAPDPDAVARAINAFVAENTNNRITDLIADGVIPADAVLALVNALYLNATWLQKFDPAVTAEATFTTGAGSEITVDMMQEDRSESSLRWDGWVAATKSYTGGLEVQFVLPDEGRFEEVATNLPAVFEAYETGRTIGDELRVPRFEIRANLELDKALQSLGLTAPYGPGQLLGISNDPLLVVDKVIHETYVRVDEAGTEAAAATAIIARAISSGGPESAAVVLDRPFLFRIVDTVSGATLFIGQITDPSRG